MSTDIRPDGAGSGRPEGPATFQRRRDPGFFTKGKANLRTLIREAANYGELRRTPYGLRPIFVLTVLGAVAAFDGGIFRPAAPEIIRDLEIDVIAIFNAINIAGFFLIFIALGLSYLGDRVNRKAMLSIGTVINGIFSLLTPTANKLVPLTLFRSGDAIAGTLQGVPLASLGADYYPPETRGRVFALSGVLSSVTTLATPLLIAFVIAEYGWRAPYYFTGPAVIAIGVAMFFLLKEPIRGYMERRSLGLTEEVARIPEEAPSFGEAWRTIWAIRTLRRLWVASIPGGVGSGIFGLFFVVWLSQFYGLSIVERAVLGVFLGLFTLPFGFLAGGMVDVLIRRRPQRVLVFSGSLGVLSSLFLIAVVAGLPLWVLVVSSALFSAAGALTGPAQAVLFLQILPAHVRTMGAGVFLLADIPGTIIRIFAVSYAFSQWGLQGALAAAVPFFIISALIQLSASGFFERDMRSAFASQVASYDWREAQIEGRGKLLVCRDVDVEYTGVQVLFGIDFDVEEGEIIALLGTNGSGKSTLLKAISGTQEAASGAIVFDGREITHMPSHEITLRGITHMPGGRGIFPGLSVRENLMLGNWATDPKEEKERLQRVYEIFPVLKERGSARAGTLSGGEQQMLSLAQAFLSKPRLLMIDELSLGLSPAVVEQLIVIVKMIHSQGTTIILVEQSVNIALTVAEKAIFMEKGEVKFLGPTKDLLRRPDILRAVYVRGAGALTEGAPASALRTARERRQITLTEARPLLEVEDVTKMYGGVVAVDGASFVLREGEILGMIGPNGAGKTTLFDVVSGYISPDEGAVIFDGADITDLRPDERARRRMIRRFQDARLFPSLTVFENILVSLEMTFDVRSIVFSALQVPQARRSERRARRRADKLVELLGLEAYRDKFVKELSTGLRRVADLACVLATEPKLLLLDEPSTGIAQAEAESLAPLLRRVRFETGCSMLVVEHDMSLISAISDELMAMDQGKVLARGAPDEVLRDERVILSYLGTSEETIRRSGILT